MFKGCILEKSKNNSVRREFDELEKLVSLRNKGRPIYLVRFV